MSTFSAAILALQAAPAGPSPYGSLFMFTAIILIFWLIIFRPQQRQRKQHEDALRALKRGDRIVTAGGIIGEVIHIKDSGSDVKSAAALLDEVTIKSGETRIIVERGRIAKIMSGTGTTTAAPTDR